MSELDDLFPGLSDDSTDETETETPPDNSSMKQLRDWAKARDKVAKQAEKLAKENEELKAFRQEVETKQKAADAGRIFSELQLPEQMAALFVKETDEVSAEKVAEWATSYGLAPKTPDPVQQAGESQGAPGTTEFKPVTEPSATFVEGKTYSLDDVKKLIKEGQVQKVNELHEQGLIKLDSLADHYPDHREN